MNALAWLIPCALLLGGLGLLAFLWTLKADQYQDLEGAAWRALQDEEEPVAPKTNPEGTKNSEPEDIQWKRSKQP